MSTTTILTAGGRTVDLVDPDPATIDLHDVAHHLSRLCRFVGAVRVEHYSVAEHAVVVAHRLADQGARRAVVLAGLHHDDSEAYLGDVSRPLKALLPGYRALEERMTLACEAALLPAWVAVTPDDLAAVRAADWWAYEVERIGVAPRMASEAAAADRVLYADHDPGTVVEPVTREPRGMRADAARELWLWMHHRLLDLGPDGTDV